MNVWFLKSRFIVFQQTIQKPQSCKQQYCEWFTQLYGLCTQWDCRLDDMEKHIPSLWRHKNSQMQLSNSEQSFNTAIVFLKQKYIFSS